MHFSCEHSNAQLPSLIWIKHKTARKANKEMAMLNAHS